MLDWFKSLFTLSEQEKELLAQIRRWPKGALKLSERGSLSVDPKVVNSLPTTIKARELADK